MMQRTRKMFSVKEEYLFNILDNVGCMSVYEIQVLMEKWQNCTPAQTYSMLNHMQGEYALDYTSDGKFILAGSRRKNSDAESLDYGVVVKTYFALSEFAKVGAKASALQDMYISREANKLVFSTDEQLFDVYTINTDSIFKIKMIEEKYLSKEHRLNTDKFCKDKMEPIMNVFIFSNASQTDLILEKMSSLGLEIPHKIVILKSKTIDGEILFDTYTP